MLCSFTIVAERLERFLEHEKTVVPAETRRTAAGVLFRYLKWFMQVKYSSQEGTYKARHLPDHSEANQKLKHVFRMLSGASCLTLAVFIKHLTGKPVPVSDHPHGKRNLS